MILTAQALLIGVVLVWSSTGKLRATTEADRTALPALVGERYAAPVYRGVGVVELVLGLALLVPPWWQLEAVAATALAVGFTAYIVYARIVVPTASCGCVGKLARPVGSRSIARSMLLLTASTGALFAGTGWWQEAASSAGIAAVELVVFAGLSPELDRYWLFPLRRLRLRLVHPLAGTASSRVPFAATHRQLLLSPAYRAVSEYLRSDVREHWDDGEWRFVTYSAAYGEQPATAVFAVRHDPDGEVKVALVDESSGRTLYRPATQLALA